MRPRRRAFVALFLALSLLSGCVSTHYVPRDPGYLALVQHDGMPMYQRDGRMWQQDFLGTGLIAATEGVPQAQRYAHDSRDAAFGFLGFYVGGLVSMLSAVPFAVSGIESGEGFNRASAASAGLLSLGVVLMGLSVWSATTMSARRFDAINAYNDLRPR